MECTALLTWPTNSLRGAMALSLIEVPTVRRGCRRGREGREKDKHAVLLLFAHACWWKQSSCSANTEPAICPSTAPAHVGKVADQRPALAVLQRACAVHSMHSTLSICPTLELDLQTMGAGQGVPEGFNEGPGGGGGRAARGKIGP